MEEKTTASDKLLWKSIDDEKKLLKKIRIYIAL
jgi:hypothetical protein